MNQNEEYSQTKNKSIYYTQLKDPSKDQLIMFLDIRPYLKVLLLLLKSSNYRFQLFLKK
jgi:hypothetical protein